MLPRLSSQNLLQRGFHIRRGKETDAAACYRIAIRQPRGTLPKLYRVHFEDSARKHELHIAKAEGIVLGFARFHTRLDGWTTLYDLAIDPRYQGLGAGRNLLYSVPTPMRLKCPIQINANLFYQHAGMRHCGTEVTRNGDLVNAWELRVLTVFCAGSNPLFAEVARRSGMAYGTRSDYDAEDYPFMVDVPFKPEDYSWEKHRRAVSTQYPIMALALDYELPSQRTEILRQLQAFRDWGVLRPTVCCKFDGAVKDIPLDCQIAVSVYSRYSGWLPQDLGEYRGRRLHLLGGTPNQWIDLIPRLRGIGAIVVSADGSSHETAAKKGTHWQYGEWHNYGDKAAYRNTMIYSGREIVRAVQESATAQQMSMFTEAQPQ